MCAGYITHKYLYQAPTASFDVIQNDSDPSIYRRTHGTSCGGIVAAAPNNGFCGVGIAYESNIGCESL